jgi:hypothetical protein
LVLSLGGELLLMIVDRIDSLINWVKWPSSIVSLVLLPLVVWSLLQLAARIPYHPWNAATFAGGIVVFVMLWRAFLAKNWVGRWIIRFEHELTHLLFAVATGHKILRFKTSEQDAQVKYRGKGNWLIVAAPYFFPTAALVLWLLSFFMPIGFLPWTNFFLGLSVGFHVVSGIHETHVGQDDLKQLGWSFCWMFLPTANLFALGLLVSMSLEGFAGVQSFLTSLYQPFTTHLPQLQGVGTGV